MTAPWPDPGPRFQRIPPQGFHSNPSHGRPRPAQRHQNPTPCPACGNHFIHSITCSNAKPGSSVIFKWPDDSGDN